VSGVGHRCFRLLQRVQTFPCGGQVHSSLSLLHRPHCLSCIK
jgi:hypothetical protein